MKGLIFAIGRIIGVPVLNSIFTASAKRYKIEEKEATDMTEKELAEKLRKIYSQSAGRYDQ